MNLGRKITNLLLLLAACGDDGGKTTEASTAPTTMTVTNTMSTTNPASSDTQDGTSGSPTDATSGAPTTGTSSAEDGPIFLSFVANVATLTQGESVTFTAILTDPDGVGDIVGGSLHSADESLQFGAFTAAGQPGTYTIALTWGQIHQTDPIEFEGGELPRAFRAVFFDQSAHKATSGTELKLVCAGGAACTGTCTDLVADGLNCGTCGRVCDGGQEACASGACLPAFGSCAGFNDGLESCADICQSVGETCVAQGCPSTTAVYFDSSSDCELWLGGAHDNHACDEAIVWEDGALYVRCCCTDTK